MTTTSLVTLGFIIIVAAGLFLLTRRLRAGQPVALRPLPAYDELSKQVGRAVESGQGIHVSLGRASLNGQAAPASVAALTVLDRLAKGSCASGAPPVVTMGDGTLLPAAQDSLRQAFEDAGRPGEFQPGMAQFLAASTFPLAYAAGVTELVGHQRAGSHILLGRYGMELGIMTEAATRNLMTQVVGSDDPLALALAYATTDKLLIGEELLAAGAYLQGKPAQLASTQLQDLLRLLAILLILFLATVGLFTNLLGGG